MNPHRRRNVLVAVISAIALVLGLAAPATAASSTVAADGFSRTVTNGLGTADTGGAWSLAGSSSRFSVASGTARLSAPAGVQLSGYLNAVNAADVDSTATLTVPALPVGGSVYDSLVVRHSASNEYSSLLIVAANGSATLNLLAGSTRLKAVTVTALTVTAGTSLRMRLQASGTSPTTVRARVWRAGTTEPTTWQASVADSTAGPQSGGSVGIRTYLSSSATNGPALGIFDDLAATVTTPNQPPTASFTATPSGLGVAVDASASSDPDGTIAGSSWTFGDGGAATGTTATHTYASAGTYLITLAVTDDQGATASTTRSVTVTAANQAPTAAFTSSTTGSTVTFDGSGSSDPDGTITAYAWDFGDGTTGSGATPSHTFATPGSYTVSLTVTDDGGLTGAVAHSVSVAGGDQPPDAVFTTTATGLHVTADGTASSDPDGTVSTYAWDFGDGTSGSGATTSHDYASGGTFTITLTVTDEQGATTTVTHPVTVTAPNIRPTAAFTESASGRAVAVDASGSSDPDGTVTAWTWTFGDGGTASGRSASHTYAADGTYSVTLTVTDDRGATGQASQFVQVAAPASTTIASDAFARTVANGLGAADTGGVWTLAGTASRFAVSSGAARLSTPAGGQLSAYLGSTTATDTDATAGVTLPSLPAGGSVYAALVLRHTATTDYTARVIIAANGAVQANVMAGGTSLRSATVPGLTASPGATVRMHAQVTGTNPTTIRVRAWLATATEPSTWAISLTDATAGLQGPGSVGLRSYASSGVTNGPAVVAFDHLAVTAPAGSGNAPPAASITASVSALTLSVDGGASTDPDGTITAYSWSFGDGTTAAGSTASHTYTAAGTYTVTLTVTDNSGATGSATTSVTTGRPTQSQWLADVDTAMTGGLAYLDSEAGQVTNGAIVLDVDNTALQSYYQPFAATPQVLAFAQRAKADGFTVLVATGRSADTGGTANQLTAAGYQVASICFRDSNAPNVQASKVACRANWVGQGYTIIANVGNHTTDLDGGNSGQQYRLPNYGFLD